MDGFVYCYYVLIIRNKNNKKFNTAIFHQMPTPYAYPILLCRNDPVSPQLHYSFICMHLSRISLFIIAVMSSSNKH